MTVVLLSAAILSLAGVALVLPFLRRAQVMDIPNSRSSHLAPIPRGGGIAVVAAVILSNLVAWMLDVGVAWPVLAAIALFGLMGFVDDLHGLAVGVRLLLQLLLSTSLAAVILAEEGLSLLVLLVAAIGLAGYTNAFNFMDGVNGISAINAALAGGWFAFVGVTYGSESLVTLGAAIGGASLGFLPWNAPRARVFLGDVGSYGLGFGVGASALVAWSSGAPLALAIAPLAIYVADTGWALTKRLLGRRPWHEAHREHVYQRLTDAGWSHVASGALPAVFGAAACFFTLQIDTAPLAGLALGLTAALYLIVPRFVVRASAAGG